MRIITCLVTCMLISMIHAKGADVRKWLYRYGYVDGTFNPKLPENKVSEGLRRVQNFAGIPVTGKLDKATIDLLKKPRCGRKDPVIKVRKNKRYVHQGTKWQFSNGETKLRWTLKNSGRSLPYSTGLNVMRQAFRFWQEKTNIDFIEIPKERIGRSIQENEIEILVSFERGDHSDPYYFDGRGGTLAHAFYPHSNKGLSGDVHFDDDEYFTDKSPTGRNLLWVATHELGHSLGLEHSNVKEAVMFPWYTKYKPGFKLHSDDILGIQTLYGARTKPKPTERKCPKGSGDITAIYYSKRYGQYIAFTTYNKILLLGYRNRIPVINRFSYLLKSKIPDRINAVLTKDVTVKGRKIVQAQIYFAGSKYYIYRDFQFIAGPYSIHRSGPLNVAFPRYAKTIDAAIEWYPNGKTYFFSGWRYWRYTDEAMNFDRGYPRTISKGWKGLPRTVQAASSNKANKKTFFIFKNKYYTYDRRTKSKQYELNSFLKCGSAPPIRDDPMLIGGLSTMKEP